MQSIKNENIVTQKVPWSLLAPNCPPAPTCLGNPIKALKIMLSFFVFELYINRIMPFCVPLIMFVRFIHISYSNILFIITRNIGFHLVLMLTVMGSSALPAGRTCCPAIGSVVSERPHLLLLHLFQLQRISFTLI